VGEEKWVLIWAKIPKDVEPIEITGLLGGENLEEEGVTKFHLNSKGAI
jgi:hypothetical protein